MSQTVLRHQSL